MITLEELVSEQTIGFKGLPLIINFGSVVSKPMLLEFATRLSNDTRQKFIKIIPFGPESVIYLRNNGFETLYDVIHSIELQEKTTAELKRGLRKSYKSLVTKQEGVLVVRIASMKTLCDAANFIIRYLVENAFFEFVANNGKIS